MQYWTLCIVVQILWATGWAKTSEPILLADISSLTFHRGWITTGRRSNPMPQLECLGGSAGCHAALPNTVHCRNAGQDGRNVKWECKAYLHGPYKLGKTQVTCEGYNYPKDPHVLKESCRLRYTIDIESSESAKTVVGWFFILVVVTALTYIIHILSPNGNDEWAKQQQDAMNYSNYH